MGATKKVIITLLAFLAVSLLLMLQSCCSLNLAWGLLKINC